MEAGFGFIEVGSVTPLPQPGNPQPRVFRLTEDEAVINRYGFNSQGAAAVLVNVKQFRSNSQSSSDRVGSLGINLGKNKLSSSAILDYLVGIATFVSWADYLVVNVSSPNTPGLRGLQVQRRKVARAHPAAAFMTAWNHVFPPLRTKARFCS